MSLDVCCSCGLKFPNPVFPINCRCGKRHTSHRRSSSVGRLKPMPQPRGLECIHLGDDTGKYLRCGGCSSNTGAKGVSTIYSCAIHGQTVMRHPTTTRSSDKWDGVNCTTCEQFTNKPLPKWWTVDQLCQDTLLLIHKLPPDIDAICGIGRSGIIPASILATILHLPLYCFSEEDGMRPAGHGVRMRKSSTSPERVLLIDDSVASGRAIRFAAKALPKGVLRAAIYCPPEKTSLLDFHARIVPVPHYFAWNFFNSAHFIGQCGFDFDGVISLNPDSEIPEEYVSHCRDAGPLNLPRRGSVPLICSARLERSRPASEEWLARHGVQYDRLELWPGKEIDRKPREVAAWKAKQTLEAGLKMYIESEVGLARLIARYGKGLTVICPPAAKVYRDY